MIKKNGLILLFILFSLFLVSASNDLSSSATVSSTSSGCAGSNWNPPASCSVEVVKDGDRSTFFALPSSDEQRIVYEFSSMKNLDYVTIEWIPGGNGAAPGNYYFSYYDGNSWITPEEWKNVNDKQSFNQVYTLKLNNPVNAKGIGIVRPIQGNGKAIGISDFHVFGSDIVINNSSNTTNSTIVNQTINNISISIPKTSGSGSGTRSGSKSNHNSANTAVNSNTNLTNYNSTKQNSNVSLGKTTIVTKNTNSNNNLLLVMSLSILGLIVVLGIFLYIKKRIKDKEFGI